MFEADRRSFFPAHAVPLTLERLDTIGMAGPLVLVRGEADLGTAVQLRTELAAMLTREARRWIVDLSGLTFCDLKGLDALRSAESAATLHGSAVMWRGVSPALQRLADTFPGCTSMRNGSRSGQL